MVAVAMGPIAAAVLRLFDDETQAAEYFQREARFVGMLFAAGTNGVL